MIIRRFLLLLSFWALTSYAENKQGKRVLVKISNERLKPIAYVDNAVIKRLDLMIRKKSKDLYESSVPKIDLTLSHRFDDGATSGDYQESRGGVSVTIPLWDPDKKGRQNTQKVSFLSSMLTELSDLEFKQKLLESKIEQLSNIRQIILRDHDNTQVADYYKVEGEILRTVADINRTIRLFESEFSIDLKGKYEQESGKIQKSGTDTKGTR